LKIILDKIIVKGYYMDMMKQKEKTAMIIRSYALDKQLLDLLQNNARANERNTSSELRYRLRQAYGIKEVMQA